LLGSSSGERGSSDHLGLIVAVSVAIPVALVVVVGVIVVVPLVVMLKRRAALARSRGAVNFDTSFNNDNNQL
jgi:hypothetical protein